MKLKSFLHFYLRSSAGIFNLVFPLIGFGGMLLAGVPAVISLAAGAGAGAGMFVLVLASGAAAKIAVREKDRLVELDYAETLKSASENRDKLKFLRISDPEIKAKVFYLVQKAGNYIELAEAQKTIQPFAHEAMENSLNILSIFLNEIDDDSAEKRFGMTDMNPFENVKKRTLEALDTEAVKIKDAIIRLGGGTEGTEKMSVLEDLNK